MKIRLKKLLTLTICGLVLKTSIFGATQVLPKGIWKIGLNQTKSEITQVGVFEDNQYKTVSKDGFKLKHTKLAPYISPFSLDGDIKVVDFYRLEETYLNIAYGLNEKLTVAVKATYWNDVVQYTDEYINEVKTKLAGYVPRPPKQAHGQGLGDIQVSAKYKFNEHWAAAFAYQGGRLKIGSDQTEMRAKSDGFEQLRTGYKADFFTYVLYHDKKIKDHSVHFTAAYEVSSNGYEKTLDNDYETDRGDTFSFTTDTNINLTKSLILAPSFTYVQTGYDEKLQDTGWTKIQGSESAATLAGLKLTYQPVIFFNTWIGYTKTLSNKLSHGNYDYPGRLYIPSILSFGTTLYLK